MKQLIVFLFAILTFIAKAQAAQSEFDFSFNTRQYSFATPVRSGMSVHVSYLLTPLTLEFKAQDLRVIETRHCAQWDSLGTSPSDPGVCGRYERSGWAVSFINGDREVYTLKRVIKDLATGKSNVTQLGILKANFTVRDSHLSRPEIPTHVTLVGHVRMSEFGCAVKPVVAQRMKGKMVDLALCEELNQDIEVQLDSAAVIHRGKLTAQATLYGGWQDQDINGEEIRRDLWQPSPQIELNFSPASEGN